MSSLLKVIRNRLCKFSGEDYTIIKECGNKVQLYFSLIGLLVLVILLCSFASAVYFTDKLFNPNNIGIGLERLFLDIGVGIVWGYIITNMYLLLLYTISPTLLPTKIRKKQEVKTKQFQLSFSMGLRIFIVILLAVIIAQPLNVFILKPHSTALAFDIKDLLASNPLATIITVAVVAVFLLPVYLKYNIRKLGEFYEKKAEIKKQIIENDYKDFKREYQKLLINKTLEYNKSVWENLMPFLNKLEKIKPDLHKIYVAEIEKEFEIKKDDYEKYEYWANPPYRTIHKSRTKNILSEQDLLNHIYSKTD